MRLAIGILAVMCLAAGPATKPAVPIKTGKEFIDEVPAKERPKAEKDWNAAMGTYLGEVITEATAGRGTRIPAAYEYYSSQHRRAVFTTKPFKWAGATLTFRYVVQWDSSQASGFKNLKPGATVPVVGEVQAVEVRVEERTEKKQKRHINSEPTEVEDKVVYVTFTVNIKPTGDVGK